MRAVLALLSGLSAGPLLHLEEMFGVDPLGPVGYALTGGIFGFLVLGPFTVDYAWWYGRVLGLVIGSIAIYALVVELAVAGYGPLELQSSTAVIVSGIAGALLVGGLTKILAPLRTSPRYWLALLVAGVLGGFVFSLLFESQSAFVVSLGYVSWQVPVFLAQSWGSK